MSKAVRPMQTTGGCTAMRLTSPASSRAFQSLHNCLPSRRGALSARCSVRANWSVDVRFGVKQEAIGLLQEWVQGVGKQAGIRPGKACILAGAVGLPESRLELDLEFNSLAEVEQFWARIPPEGHRAWIQRAQNYILDGSPVWRIYHVHTVDGSSESDLVSSTQLAEPSARSFESIWGAPPAGQVAQETANGQQSRPVEHSDESAAPLEPGTVLDWKGDPMKINPGDRMPGM